MSETAEPPSHAEQITALKQQWAELPAKQWQLLRLAPLANERNSGPRPLRFAELARCEHHGQGLSLLRLSVQLPAQVLHREQNVLEVWLDHSLRTLEFGPADGLQVEPSNRGLGRFLAAQGILWAQQRCGHYQVLGGDFAAKDSFEEHRRKQRDHLLESLGFVVVQDPSTPFKGSYSAALASSLRGEWNHDKLQPVSLLDAGKMLQQADQNLAEQASKLRHQEQQLASNLRDESALRFTISTLVVFCLFQAALLLWLMVR
jgi:hypothetical protein